MGGSESSISSFFFRSSSANTGTNKINSSNRKSDNNASSEKRDRSDKEEDINQDLSDQRQQRERKMNGLPHSASGSAGSTSGSPTGGRPYPSSSANNTTATTSGGGGGFFSSFGGGGSGSTSNAGAGASNAAQQQQLPPEWVTETQLRFNTVGPSVIPDGISTKPNAPGWELVPGTAYGPNGAVALVTTSAEAAAASANSAASKGVVTKGCEPCVHPPRGPTGMNLFQQMRREWLKKTVATIPPPTTLDDYDPDDVLDAIEETPGEILDPPVHAPVMLDLLLDVWEENGLYE